MPLDIYTNSFMHLHSSQILTRFPVPEPQFTISISTSQELAIRREIQPAGIARIKMSTKLLLSVHFEVTLAIINYNFVVHRLTCEVFSIWVHCCCWYSLHVRLTDMFSNYGNTKLPQKDFLIICCRYKSSATLNKCQCIDTAQVLLILKCDFTGISIKLQNFLVSTTC